MNLTSFGKRIGVLISACLLLPLAAHANPVMLDPSSLMAFCVVAFWAFVVEAGVVALLLAFRGVAPLRVFLAYFVANAAVFFLLFEPLLYSGKIPVLALEALVVLIDCLIIKLLVSFSAFEDEGYKRVSWLRSTLISGVGNTFSYLVGYLATLKPWERH